MFNMEFSFYSIMILLALLLNVLTVIYFTYKYNFNKEHTFYLLIFENIGIIFGGKLYTFITHYNIHKNSFAILKLGMSSLGAVIGAIVMIIFFCIIFKRKISVLLCIFAPSIPLMYGIGKIGCFFEGCCRGIIYNGFGSVTYKYGYENSSLSYFPIQLLEAIIFIVIFIYLFYLHKNKKYKVKTNGVVFILCGIAKFSLDFLRLSHVNKVLSINQIVSLVFILIGIVIYIKNRKYNY